MQKLWRQAKHILIFLGIWTSVTGLATVLTLLLLHLYASDEQWVALQSVENGVEKYLFELNALAFLLTYIAYSYISNKISDKKLRVLCYCLGYLFILVLLFLLSSLI